MEMEIAAWVVSALVFATFFMKTMTALRVVAITSNVAFIAYALLGLRYGIFEKILPIFVLHALLLPLNIVRLYEMRSYFPLDLSASARIDDNVARGLIASGSMRTSMRAEVSALCARSNAASKSAVASTVSPCRP